MNQFEKKHRIFYSASDLRAAQGLKTGNGRIRRALGYTAAAIATVAVMIGILLLVVDAIDKEAQWQEERLCRIYEICKSEGGA